jgi:feruloyl-CoA synthase
MNMVLTAGGTLYIDGGRPVAGMFAQTIANLADVPPTIYFNVPAGYAQLVPVLEGDEELAQRFFSRLRLIFNAAAALPPALRERLAAVARKATSREVPVTGSWGATETAPAVTSAHYSFDDARCIGVPLPGAEVKLAPAGGGAYEIRVKGPNVTPGYFARPDLTREAFDDEGFYRSGDAVALADPGDLNAGLIFRGRIAEDFKLLTGTFVRVGAVRTALLSAIPALADAVLAGEDRDYVGALAWLNPAEARSLLGEQPGPDAQLGELIIHDGLRAHLARALARHNDAAGSSARIQRIAVLARAASLDDGEITDKGTSTSAPCSPAAPRWSTSSTPTRPRPASSSRITPSSAGGPCRPWPGPASWTRIPRRRSAWRRPGSASTPGLARRRSRLRPDRSGRSRCGRAVRP